MIRIGLVKKTNVPVKISEYVDNNVFLALVLTANDFSDNSNRFHSGNDCGTRDMKYNSGYKLVRMRIGETHRIEPNLYDIHQRMIGE